MKKFEVENHKPSFLPEGDWKLVWSDEFDGTELDRTKWNYRLTFWGKPFDAFTDEGVVVKDSHLELHRVEKNGLYASPQLQTGSNSFDVPKDEPKNQFGGDVSFWPLGELEEPKFVHRYGYYECRCKFQKEPEVMWSAFWLQSPSIGTRFEPEWCGIESDIMEYFQEGKTSSGNIYGGYGKQFTEDGRVNEFTLPETEDGWHYFGLDWQPDGYVFYCDGQVVTRCNKKVSHVPQFLLLTTEVKGYRRKQPLKVGQVAKDYYPGNWNYEVVDTGKGFTDDAFIVDFVRVYDKIGD